MGTAKCWRTTCTIAMGAVNFFAASARIRPIRLCGFTRTVCQSSCDRPPDRQANEPHRDHLRRLSQGEDDMCFIRGQDLGSRVFESPRRCGQCRHVHVTNRCLDQDRSDIRVLSDTVRRTPARQTGRMTRRDTGRTTDTCKGSAWSAGSSSSSLRRRSTARCATSK